MITDKGFIMHTFFHNLTVVSYVEIVHVLLKKELVRLQKRAARIILVPSFVLFSKLRCMTLPERVIYQKAIQMFDTILGEAPD